MVPVATGDTPMTTDEFRERLAEFGMTQRELSRLLAHLGDPALPVTILRRVERWCQGATTIPGEMAAFMNLLSLYPYVLRKLRKEEWPHGD